MKRTYRQAMLNIEWGMPVNAAMIGAVMLFTWSIIKSGESGPELPSMHLLGICMVYVAWACLALSPLLLWRAIEAARRQS